MSKIWYCPNCGYEVTARGRCHLCRQRLVASSLPELPEGEEDDEVGCTASRGGRMRERGRLIEQLNVFEIIHRFEDDELVVAAEDETRVGRPRGRAGGQPGGRLARRCLGGELRRRAGRGVSGASGGPREDEDQDEWVGAAVRLLADAARAPAPRPDRDMHADADVAEASAAVFMVDEFYGADAEEPGRRWGGWHAPGCCRPWAPTRPSRRRSALQAAVLDKLLAPRGPPAGAEG